MTRNFEITGVHIPEILLPAENIQLNKWAVVACDQYTSQPEYWKEVECIVGDAPSTLHLIFPEIYLEKEDNANRIEKINNMMQKYINDGTLSPQKPGFIFIDRKTSSYDGSHCETNTSKIKSRKGLVLSVDLEKYDYSKGSQTLIRATEGTVIDRLPPRIKIRENALIELPHIMLLIDDPLKTVIEPLTDFIKNQEKLYAVKLMMNGGSILSFKIDDDKLLTQVLDALEKLADPKKFKERYGLGSDEGVLLFAAGDGNHSLAAAKGHWENIKKTISTVEQQSHPSRYALVEVVNVHDEGLDFEPIHRVLFNVDYELLLKEMTAYFCECSPYYKIFASKENMIKMLEEYRNDKKSHFLSFVTERGYGIITVTNPKCNLEVGTLQTFLDDYLKMNTEMKIDYIHGEEVVASLGSEKGNMGFFLPPMNKNDLFKTVILDGALPRKTFSMGEAEEKRFYLECKKIR